MEDVFVESMVGLMTQEPLVQLTVGQERVQMSPSEARDVALNLFEASAASVTDLFLVTFLQERVGADMNAAGNLLAEFRAWRSERGTDNVV